MADKEVHIRESGLGAGLIGGIAVALLIGLGLLFVVGGLDLKDGKDVRVNVETPKLDKPDLEVEKPSAKKG